MPVTIYTETQISEAIIVLAEKIYAAHTTQLSKCALIGIIPRGVPVAKRIANHIYKTKGILLPVGQLEVSLYRENLTHDKNRYISLQETDIPFRLKDKTLILINDIFYEGKGVRAALNSLMDFDSPKKIELGVLIDRGNRSLPIHPDYTVHRIQTQPNDIMETKLLEINGEDSISLEKAVNTR